MLKDFRNKNLKRYYRSASLPSLENIPIAKRELLQRDQYDTINLVQTSRGCPYKCHFCSVSSLYGKGVRVRPVVEVITEIETLAGDDILFVDDNLVGKKAYANELLNRLAPLKKKWIGQAAVTVVNQKEVLKLLQKSGCAGLFVGFETNSSAKLNEVGKFQNINSDYFLAVQKLHEHGIAILGSFIVGFDSDDQACFEGLLEFVVKSKIDVVDVTVLTPYPGTILYERMKAQKRLIDDHWWLKYDASDVVFKPKRMTRAELYQGRVWVLKELYKLSPLLKRWLGGISRRSFFGNYISLIANFGFRKNANALPLDSCDRPKENYDVIIPKGMERPFS